MPPTPPEPVRIESLDDPRVDDYRDVRDADLVGRRGLFMAEGELVVRALLDSPRFRPRSLLLSDKREASMRDAIARMPEGAPVFVAEQSLMSDIVGFHIHRGVLAAGERRPEPDPAEIVRDLPEGPCVVLCLQTLANHDNVGGVIRAAAAFGAGAVLLDERSCDPLYRKAIRVSMGHALRVPFARAGATTEHIDLLRRAGFTVCALTPGEPAEDLDRLVRNGDAPRRAAILLGAEGPGLSREVVAQSDRALRIPMAPGVDSLNVAQAASVACFALRAAASARAMG